MESFHLLNNHTSSAEREEQGLPSFQSFVSRSSPSPSQWQPDMGTSPPSGYNFVRLQNQVQLLRNNSELQEQESKFAISPMPTTAGQHVVWLMILAGS
jgi:hypothetical protein